MDGSMIVMPSNNTSGIVHYFAGLCRENPNKYPYKIGLLFSPRGWSNPPYYMPYALDNGCFIKWEPEKFEFMLLKVKSLHKPLWVVVPDVVGDAESTIKRWHEWKDKIFGLPLAFACQDGMEPQDVPSEAKCCFIGGTTDWKLSHADKFKGVCDLLHIGRVNTSARLAWAKDIGADSVDGTGWFRARNKQYTTFINLWKNPFNNVKKKKLKNFFNKG